MLRNIKNISTDELAVMGLSTLAYIKPHEEGFSIHAADGTKLALAGDWGGAMSAVIAHDLCPVLVH